MVSVLVPPLPLCTIAAQLAAAGGAPEMSLFRAVVRMDISQTSWNCCSMLVGHMFAMSVTYNSWGILAKRWKK